MKHKIKTTSKLPGSYNDSRDNLQTTARNLQIQGKHHKPLCQILGNQNTSKNTIYWVLWASLCLSHESISILQNGQ